MYHLLVHKHYNQWIIPGRAIFEKEPSSILLIHEETTIIPNSCTYWQKRLLQAKNLFDNTQRLHHSFDVLFGEFKKALSINLVLCIKENAMRCSILYCSFTILFPRRQGNFTLKNSSLSHKKINKQTTTTTTATKIQLSQLSGLPRRRIIIM